MSFLLQSLVFLVAAIVVVPVCRRLGLSSVLGYLAAGLLVGPPVLGLIGEANETMHFAELGVVLLLFIIGLELHPRRLWVMRHLVFGLGTLQVVITTVLIGDRLYTDGAMAAAAGINFVLTLSGETTAEMATSHDPALMVIEDLSDLL